jgi:hypothetical protein
LEPRASPPNNIEILVTSRDPTNVRTSSNNWLSRSTAPGVTLATDFSSDKEVLPHRYANGSPAKVAEFVKRVTPHVDNGIPCLKITSIEGAGGDQQGQSWRRRFKPLSDWPKDEDGFGTAPFWIQFGVKIPASRLIPFRPGAGSWKFAIVANMSVSNPWGAPSQSSNLISHVLTNSPLKGTNFPIIYVHNNSRPNGTPLTGLRPGMISGSDIDMSPGWDRGAEFTNIHERYCSYRFPALGCPQWPIDTWVWFQLRIHIRTFGGKAGNEVDLWWAKDGEKTWTVLQSHRDYLAGLSTQWPNGFNAIWLTPYETNRTIAGGVDSYILYRHLIVSTQPPPLP